MIFFLIGLTQTVTLLWVWHLHQRINDQKEDVQNAVDYCNEQVRNACIGDVKNAECLVGQAQILSGLINALAPKQPTKVATL